MDELSSGGWKIEIWDNPALTSLTGLNKLTSIKGTLSIKSNDAITSLTGLDNLDSIGGDIYIKDNDALLDLSGLENLTSIGWDLSIQNNPALEDLAGLDKLTSIGEDLIIRNNNSLIGLWHLDKLTSIGDSLNINNNPVLTSLSGIDNIDAGSIEELSITDNILLSICEVWSICDYLSNPTGTVEINNNAPGCNSRDEVETACFKIIKPKTGDLFISGETDTIKWTGGQSGQLIKLEYSIDDGATFVPLADNIPAESKEYIWDVPYSFPDAILTTKAIVHLLDQNSSDVMAASEKFTIKHWVLTRLDDNGDLVAYDFAKDVWGFKNSREDMWPEWYYIQFDYSGTDPFTSKPYDHEQAPVFAYAKDSNYVPWRALVWAYTTEACYTNQEMGLYRPLALFKWRWWKTNNWGGSCWAIAGSNALAFSERQSFYNAFPAFPHFNDPIDVSSDVSVIDNMSLLFAQQYGYPTKRNRIEQLLSTTPNQVVEELKELFGKAKVESRSITFWHQDSSWGHNVLPYRLRKDPSNNDNYFIDLYDNNYPDLVTNIEVKTAANGGNGSWNNWAYPKWGGSRFLYLELDAKVYFTPPPLKTGGRSPFLLSDDELQIGTNDNTDIMIRDIQGNVTGYWDDQLKYEIEGSVPLTIPTGSFQLPYGYHLLPGEYSVTLDNFTSEESVAYFFVTNMAYIYNRLGAEGGQTDRLTFGDGLSVVNPDEQIRPVKLELIIDEEDRDKVFRLDPLPLNSGDSVRLHTPDNNYVKLYNYDTGKNYGIELNSVTSSEFEKFFHADIPIGENTLHYFDINWSDVDESVLYVYVDEDMDGSYEDTLMLNNQAYGIDDDEYWDPNRLSLTLAPNPVDDIIQFNFKITGSGRVVLKLYDLRGKEVAAPVVLMLESGEHSIPIDASNLPVGIYFYHLTAGVQSATGKMMVIH